MHDTVLGSTYKTSYYYNSLDRINQVYDGGVKELYTYDTVGRLSAKQTYISSSTLVLTESRRFHASTRGDTGTTTGMVYKQTFSAANYSPVFQYNYHTGGNISAFSDGTYSSTYSYDNLGQLIRENNPAANKTWVWTYDNAGNITSRKEYAYTTGTLGTVQSTVNYTYCNSNWKDLLTAYNGQSISYDAIGNPTSMLGWTYTWEHGRQLASMSSGGTTWSFDYNADGLRYRRSNGSTTYTYYYNGDMLRYLDINGTKLYFVLDANGQPIEVSYKPANSTTTSFYFYVHNLMGDVMAILDTSGNAVVKYTYDAWGNIISTTGSMASTLGQQNPFRYRSYVYDQETGLYYLQSRYYNPQIGRFINADALVTTGQGILGNNMFAYCGNNPVNRADYHGDIWGTLIMISVFCVTFLAGCSEDSGPYAQKANCYAYALMLEYDPTTGGPFKKKPDPGVFSGDPLDNLDLCGIEWLVAMNIEQKISNDCSALGFYFRKVDNAEHEVSEGNWLIAVAYSPHHDPQKVDFHFWRRGSDGLWSHKPGTNDIMYVDYSGNPITDPLLSDRGKYSYFIGYYEVGKRG